MAAGVWALRFQDWANRTITLEPWEGAFDIEGKAILGAPVIMSCRIDSKVRMVRDFQGNERASNTTVYVLGGPLDPHDRITMPNDFKGPSQPPILNVSNYDDVSGFSHSEVYL